MQKLFGNIRFYVLVGSILLSFLIYLFVVLTIPSSITQLTKLQEWYALLAILYLYLALLATPLTRAFLSFPGRGPYLKARRAIGVSAWYFGLLHALISFFGQLGGFSGLFFLSNKYLLAIALSGTALLIMSLMAATSFDQMVVRLTYPRWKLLHRFVYPAGIFILIHALLLGTHFADLSGIIPQLTFGALGILFLLEALRIDTIFQRKYPTLPRFGVWFVSVSVLIAGIVVYLFLPTTQNGQVSFGIHAAHIQLAQQAQSGQLAPQSTLNKNIPGLDGDPTKRYTVSLTTVPQQVIAGQPVELHFAVFDAMSGNPVSLFKILYAKTNHLIIVNSDLSNFSHIHATQQGSEFVVQTTFPKDDVYHLYISFQPFGGIEQQIGFSLPVGSAPASASAPAAKPDTVLSKQFGNYIVTMTKQDFVARQMALGQQKMTFTITDAKTHKPVMTLKPYLASFGHLTVINTENYDFLHVHPYSLIIPKETDTAGPTVAFLPLGIYGAFRPGTYRVFAEFNPDGILTTADFTIQVH